MRRVFDNSADSSVDSNFDSDDGSWTYDLQSFVHQATSQQGGTGQIGSGLGSSLSLSTGFTSSSSDASASRSSSDAPGPLVLLDDDGHLAPVTAAPGSGSQTTLGSTQGTAPAPTLVGSSGGLQFNLIWDASVGSAPASFVSAVITAATFYTQLFSNHEVINVQVGYGEVAGSTIGTGALAESESYGYTETYAQVSAGLKGDASSSTSQATADSNLPSGDPTNGGSFFVSTAEAKALGQVSGTDTNTDGYIGLSSSYSFSFGGSPAAGQFDAIGAMEHELSEVMGRIGSVGSLFGAGIYTPLDLFRYSSPGNRALSAGPGYFSIDNGNTNLGTYNNPLNGGDASDWTPSFAGDSYGSGYPGMAATVSANDIVEDSVLGYVLARQDQAPVVTAASFTTTRNQTFAASSLFSVSDADGDAITAYQFWDSLPASGHWVVGGAAQPGGQAINVTPAQLATATYQTGLTPDHLWVRAYDGTQWSAWQDFYANVIDHPPVVTATVANYSASRNQVIAATSLFSVSDADNDAITAYKFWDSAGGSGHWVVGGVAQPSAQAINVTPALLSSATFQAVSGSDHLWVQAYDGIAWGAWQDFYVNAPVDHAPVVTAAGYTASHDQNIAATSLFSVSDADSDPITAYQLWDSTPDSSSGSWIVGGVAQPAGQAINMTPAQLASATFQSGSGSDQLWVRAFDGALWSNWVSFNVNAPVDQAPVVSASNAAGGLTLNSSVAASGLFNAADADHDAIKTYELWDSVNPASSGHFLLSGTVEASGQGIFLDASQFSQTSFVASSTPTTDRLWERAFDGNLWSDWTAVSVTSHT